MCRTVDADRTAPILVFGKSVLLIRFKGIDAWSGWLGGLTIFLYVIEMPFHHDCGPWRVAAKRVYDESREIGKVAMQSLT